MQKTSLYMKKLNVLGEKWNVQTSVVIWIPFTIRDSRKRILSSQVSASSAKNVTGDIYIAEDFKQHWCMHAIAYNAYATPNIPKPCKHSTSICMI